MAKIDQLVQAFLDQPHIAVVGISDKRESGCNLAYRTLKAAGHHVTPVNPHLTTYDGVPCYPTLAAIPEKPGAVFILANPRVTDQIVQECVDLGIRHVWMHCLLGTKPGLAAGISSVSPEAVRLCREHGIAVIPGTCPNQYLNADFGHSLMRVACRTLGLHSVN